MLRAVILPFVSTNLSMHQNFFSKIVSWSFQSVFSLQESGHFLVEMKTPM